MTTPTTTHTAARRALRTLVLVAAFAALLVSAAPGVAAQSCGRKVLDDWYDGRVDGTYALHCYDDAIEIIPRDVRDYSSAADDIKRALQAAMRGEPAPPNKNGPPGQDDEPDAKPGTTPPVTTPGSGGDPPSGPDALPPVGESASSIPIPLLVLAGLALLLILGGAAGYAVRRLQNRRLPPPAL